MSALYNHMVAALREHWTAHSQQYPQRFELTDAALRELNDTRKLVNDTMNYVLRPGQPCSWACRCKVVLR
jgi:hypothetical protein